MIKKKGNGHKLCYAVKYSLGTQQQKNDYNLAKGLRINYCKGGYETQEKPRLSTGGRGVQAWRDPEVGGNRKKINFV